jgi:hypothetical protein
MFMDGPNLHQVPGLQPQVAANYNPHVNNDPGAAIGGALAPPSLGKLIYIPTPLLYESKINLTRKIQREQENNALVASASLQTAIFAILRFKECYKSHFSKGDDTTALTNLNQCIAELRQANAPQVCTHAFSWLVTDELAWITDVREIFEHCIKTIAEFPPLLTGRRGISGLEVLIQTHSWPGWKQQALQIDMNNHSVGVLLKVCKQRNEIPKNILQEIKSFHESISYITHSYQKEQYPQGKAIAGIYEEHGIQLHIPSHLDETLEIIPDDKKKTPKN